MAKKVQTTAHEAILKYGEADTFDHAMFQFCSILKGKVNSVAWFKNKKGVAETIEIKFNDGSKVKATKFIKKDNSLSTSIKIV